MGFIYKITNNINNKIYIGKTNRDINVRFQEHIDSSNSINSPSYNYHLHRAYGYIWKRKFEEGPQRIKAGG